MIRFACPRCAAVLSAPDDCAGRVSRCRCGQQVVVPHTPSSHAQPQIPPGVVSVVTSSPASRVTVPPIRFACVRCQAVLEVPGDQDGQKVACPECGQRLQIPAPRVNRTVLAPLVSGPPTALSSEQPPREPAEKRRPGKSVISKVFSVIIWSCGLASLVWLAILTDDWQVVAGSLCLALVLALLLTALTDPLVWRLVAAYFLIKLLVFVGLVALVVLAPLAAKLAQQTAPRVNPPDPPNVGNLVPGGKTK